MNDKPYLQNSHCNSYKELHRIYEFIIWLQKLRSFYVPTAESRIEYFGLELHNKVLFELH